MDRGDRFRQSGGCEGFNQLRRERGRPRSRRFLESGAGTSNASCRQRLLKRGLLIRQFWTTRGSRPDTRWGEVFCLMELENSR